MKKIIFSLLLITLSLGAFAQTASEKSIKEICACVKKIDPALSEEEQSAKAVACMSSSMEKNILALKKEYNIQSDNMQEVAQQIGAQVGMKLMLDCPDIVPYLMKYAQNAEDELTEDADIDPNTLKADPAFCAYFKSGKYRNTQNYVNKKLAPQTDTSVYTEIKQGFLFDYFQSSKYYSKWTVRWINACEWEQTLVETTEPNMKMVIKKGDKLNMKIIGTDPSGKKIWISSNLLGLDIIMVLEKMK